MDFSDGFFRPMDDGFFRPMQAQKCDFSDLGLSRGPRNIF